jgi:hypothetical protein
MSVSKIYKGSNGWTGETTFPGAQDEYTWKITTLKRNRGKIASYANAWQYEDGSLVWDMFMAPKIELGETTGNATEASIKAEHYKAVAIFEQMMDAGEVPQRDQPKPGSNFSSNAFGLTESEGDGDSHIGDAWKDSINNKQDENKANGIIVDKAFFSEHRSKIRGSVRNDANLLAGFNFVDKATAEGTDWSTYATDEFVKQMTDQFFKSVTPVLKATKPYLFKEPDRGYTGYRWEGSAYERTRDLNITEIAKLAREEFAAIFPEMKWSVRIDRFAGGQSINATGTNYPYNPYTKEYLDEIAKGKTQSQISESNWRYKNAGGSEMYVEVYNDQYKKDLKTAEQVLKQYRFNDSDGGIDYFHTNFYDHTKIDLTDWEQKLFENDPEVKRSKEFWAKVAEDKKKSSEAAKAKIKDLGIIPKYVIIEYTTYWRGLDKNATVPGIITKSPNGRSRWSLNYDIKFIPPTHPKAGYRYKNAFDGISLTSVKVDESAARLTLAQYTDKVLSIAGLKNDDYYTKKYGKAIEKAWKYARERAGIVDKPKAVNKPTKSTKKAVASKPIVSASDIEFNIIAGKHTKTGADIWTVTITGRVSAEDFNELRAKAKDNGGYYSSFRGNGAIPGFIFKTENAANYFAGIDAKEKSKVPFSMAQMKAMRKGLKAMPGSKKHQEALDELKQATDSAEKLKLLRLKAKALKLKYKY